MVEEWCHEQDLHRVRLMVIFCCAAAAAGLTMQSMGLCRGIAGDARPRHANTYLYEVHTISRECTSTNSRHPDFSFRVDRLFWAPVTYLLQARRLDGGITKRGSEQPHGQGCEFDSYHFGSRS